MKKTDLYILICAMLIVVLAVLVGTRAASVQGSPVNNEGAPSSGNLVVQNEHRPAEGLLRKREPLHSVRAEYSHTFGNIRASSGDIISGVKYSFVNRRSGIGESDGQAIRKQVTEKPGGVVDKRGAWRISAPGSVLEEGLLWFQIREDYYAGFALDLNMRRHDLLLDQDTIVADVRSIRADETLTLDLYPAELNKADRWHPRETLFVTGSGASNEQVLNLLFGTRRTRIRGPQVVLLDSVPGAHYEARVGIANRRKEPPRIIDSREYLVISPKTLDMQINITVRNEVGPVHESGQWGFMIHGDGHQVMRDDFRRFRDGRFRVDAYSVVHNVGNCDAFLVVVLESGRTFRRKLRLKGKGLMEIQLYMKDAIMSPRVDKHNIAWNQENLTWYALINGDLAMGLDLSRSNVFIPSDEMQYFTYWDTPEAFVFYGLPNEWEQLWVKNKEGTGAVLTRGGTLEEFSQGANLELGLEKIVELYPDAESLPMTLFYQLLPGTDWVGWRNWDLAVRPVPKVQVFEGVPYKIEVIDGDMRNRILR